MHPINENHPKFISKQAVADDKKKKQDEKLRKVQQLREAQEKEKLEKQRKLLQVRLMFGNGYFHAPFILYVFIHCFVS